MYLRLGLISALVVLVSAAGLDGDASLVLLQRNAMIVDDKHDKADTWFEETVQPRPDNLAEADSNIEREKAFLEYVQADPGSRDCHKSGNCADAILDAADKFGKKKQWMMNVGDEKGAHLDDALQEGTRGKKAPNVLEVGTYVGYSTLRLARKLSSSATLYTVELSIERQKIAKQFLNMARPLEPNLVFLNMDAEEAMRSLKSDGVQLDFVFIDHAKSDYYNAVKTLVDLELLNSGAVVIADNTACEKDKNDDYLEYVRTSGFFQSRSIDATVAYSNVKDAMEVSVFNPRTSQSAASKGAKPEATEEQEGEEFKGRVVATSECKLWCADTLQNHKNSVVDVCKKWSQCSGCDFCLE